MARGRPNKSEPQVVGYLREKGEPVLDLQLDAAPFAAWVREQGDSPVELRSAVKRLRNKGLLHTVQRGRYVVNLDAQPSRGPLLDELDPLGEAVLRRLDGMRHYVSFHSALWRHGLIDQQSRTLFVAVDGRKRDVKFAQWQVRFVTLNEEHFFGWDERELGPNVLRMATVEKALLDSLYLPRLAGRVPVVVRAMARAWEGEQLDPERLIDYTIRFDRPSLSRRIGYFMELLGIPDADRLLPYTGRMWAVPLTPGSFPNAGQHTPVDSRWRVFENPRLTNTVLEWK
jgi:predicted transcriptional regulator of viral defense system